MNSYDVVMEGGPVGPELQAVKVYRGTFYYVEDAVERIAELKQQLKDAKSEIIELDLLNVKLSKLLDGICESVKGTLTEKRE